MANDFLTPPENPFAPFVPAAASPWDKRWASHLLRRAALGPTSAMVDKLTALSPAKAVDALLDYNPANDPFSAELDSLADFLTLSNADQVQQWWYHRMLNTTQPAQERIALYWHNHFATSASKVMDGKMLAGQIDLFRQKGLGSFRELLKSVTKDPAMLVWLDGQTNRKGKPNENYGREVMELFTLGIGHYTEQDVKEIARAFTGWQATSAGVALNPSQFDADDKTVFGVTGPLDADGAIDLILQQPAAAEHLSQKLLRAFVHPNPTQLHIDYYASRLLEHDWEIKPVLKEMLTSRLFFSDWAYRSKIKSPVELVVGAVLAMGGRAGTEFVRQQANRMGQTLLYPPNVKGWDGEQAWINSNTLLLRFNLGQRLATPSSEYITKPDLETAIKTRGAQTADEVINCLVDLFLDGRLDAQSRTDLADFMYIGPDGKTTTFAYNHNTYTTKVRPVIHMLMATPEYQLA
jgi:uncharacterized protein (DUF1800 family)